MSSTRAAEVDYVSTLPVTDTAPERPNRDATTAGAARLRVSLKRLAMPLLAWPLPLLLLALWWLGARQQWISPQVLPSPEQTWQAFLQTAASGELQRSALISLQRVLYGFLVGGLVGIPLGVGMGLSKTIKEYLYPTFKMIAYIPMLGWLPLLVLLVGIGEALKIILIAKAAFVPITLNTYSGIRGVPPQYIEMARVYRFSRWQLLRRIVFPAAFPQIWSGVRYGLTQAWLLLVVVEFLASSEGLGYLMINGQQLFQLDLVLVAVVAVGIIGFALDKLLALIEARVLRWRRVTFK
ncbi:MAG: ABC transporter permease [Janthinobacterium lividum]